MNARHGRSLGRLDRGIEPLRDLVRRTDATPVVGRLVAKLETSITRLHHLAEQERFLSPRGYSEAGTTARLRQRLRREYMIPLTRLGRRLFAFAPAVEKTLKVPHARASHRELVTTGQAMLKAVRPHRAILLSAGVPKTFLTEFRDLTRELERITTTTSERQLKFVRVSRMFRDELASANETFRILEGLALAHIDKDASFAFRWKRAMRTPKPLGRPSLKKRKRSPNDAAPEQSPESPLTA